MHKCCDRSESRRESRCFKRMATHCKPTVPAQPLESANSTWMKLTSLMFARSSGGSAEGLLRERVKFASSLSWELNLVCQWCHSVYVEVT